MAHFAQIDSNNIVQQVVVVSDADAVSGQDFLNSIGLSGTWIQTSYNTRGGKHYTKIKIARTSTSMLSSYDVSGNFISAGPVTNTIYVTVMSADGLSGLRYNYAGIGYTYDSVKDAFIAPQPYPSWTLNVASFIWEAPIAKPSDGKRYMWNENTTSWVTVSS